MSVDIKLESGSLSMGYEDFELVSGEECLIQDIRSELFTDIGALYYEPSYGSRVLRYIQGARDNLTLVELKQAVKIALKSDERIVPNSIVIQTEQNANGIIVFINFKAVEYGELSMEVIYENKG